jgi:NAD(P) transhydrogenase subunit alpha
VSGVTIVAPLNVPSLLAEDASELYAKNQYHLLSLMLKDNVIKLDFEDEVVAAMLLTHDGQIKSAAEVTESKPRRSKEKAAGPVTLVA